MKTIFALSILLFALLLQSCKPEWDIPPESYTYFKIKKNGVELDDSTLLKTVLYYYNDKGVAITDPDDVSEGGSNSDDTAFMHLAAAPFEGDSQFINSHIAFFYFVGGESTSGISPNTYYLKYPDGDIDTLYIFREIVSNKQGKKERCYCTSPLRTLKFNGKDAVEDTSIHLLNGQPVFLFEK